MAYTKNGRPTRAVWREEFFLAYTRLEGPEGAGGYLVPNEFAPAIERMMREQAERRREEAIRVCGLGEGESGRRH